MSKFKSVLLQKKEISGVGYARYTMTGKDRLSMHGSCVIYKVEAGSVDIVVRGVTSHLRQGDRIQIEPNTPYYKEGDATLFARDFPPFDPSTLVFLE